jgi:hypothetical protein
MKIRFVGGPFDGDDKECNGCSTFLVPDSRDMARYVRSDGTIGMLFGQHTYELKWNVRVGADGNREDHPHYEYVGYEKPKDRP